MELRPIKPLDSLATPLPSPLERLRLAPALSGAAGSNRAPASATRIAAADDLAAVAAWLARYADSAATLANHLAFLHLDLTDPDLREHAVAQSREMREQIRRLLDAAVTSGELDPCDTARLAQAVYTTYNGALVSWAIDGDGPLPR